MCASGPGTRNRPAQAGSRPGGGRWYLGALALHAAGLAALVWLTPLRGLVREAPEPARSLSRDEVRQVRETVEKATAAKVRRQLERLDEIRREMAAMEAERLERLREAAPETAADPARALVSMRRAEEAMRRGAAEMEAPEEPATLASLDEADQQLAAAFEQLPALDPRYRPILTELDEVRSLQDRARQAWTRGSVDAAGSELGEARDDAERRSHDYEKKRAELEKKERQIEERRDKQASEEAKLAGLVEELAAETDPRKRERLEEKIASQRERVAKRAGEVEKYLARAAEVRREMAEREELASAAVAGIEAVREEVDESRATAAEWQGRAIGAQQELIDRLEAAMHGTAAEPSAPAAGETVTPEQAYARALQREREITGAYKTWRAAELALLREMPLGEALRQTDVVRPQRPALESPAGAAGTAAALEARKQQLETVLRETTSMVSLAENLLGMSQRRAARHGAGLEVALERERAEERNRLASVDLSGRVADLTALDPSSSSSSPSRGPSAAGAGDGSAGGSDGGDRGARPGDGPDGGGGRGEARFAAGDGDGFTPPQEISTGKLDVFSRKISPRGDAARWMSPASWYVIGPFPNPGRANIDRQFPPESVIDLDASYIGKDNRIIRWDYHPAGRPRVTPRNEEPYGIWYATTEVWGDRERDVWLALGSDDQGRLWVNGRLVWISASRHKDWTLGEALRRVRLQAGRNRLLYRVENGHGGMAFSLCISLNE